MARHRQGEGRYAGDTQMLGALANQFVAPRDPAIQREPGDDGIGHPSSEAHLRLADPNPIDPASDTPKPMHGTPDQGGGQLCSDAHVFAAAPTPHRIDPASQPLSPNKVPPDQGAAQNLCDTLGEAGSPNPIDAPRRSSKPSSQTAHHAEGQSPPDDQLGHALGPIIELWRQRQDLKRAEQRLDLQCQAVCRSVVGGDKESAGKLWSKIKSGKASDVEGLEFVLLPYRAGMAPLQERTKGLEKQLCKMVKLLPLWTEWGLNVRGLGELSFAGIIGEAAGLPSKYRSVSALWKRFGLAVIDGGRQRRVSDADAALVHGYAPQRRAYAYVVSTNLMRAQREGDAYRAVYDRRKAYELAREIPKAHAHNRALRVMVKELLKDAWVASRRPV